MDPEVVIPEHSLACVLRLCYHPSRTELAETRYKGVVFVPAGISMTDSYYCMLVVSSSCHMCIPWVMCVTWGYSSHVTK
jgi:hypothetical protein